MLLRLRNASIALVGVVAAVGLGLTLFISQLGFPGAFSGPIPGNPTKVGTVHEAIALTHDPSAAPASRADKRNPRSAANVPARHRRGGGQGGADSALGGSRQIAATPSEPPAPPASQPPSSAPVSEPTAQPTQPAAVAPAPSSSPVVAESPSKLNDGSVGLSKGTSDAGHGVSAVVKTNTSPAEKASKDQSVASSPKPAAAAPPPTAPAPQASNPAAAKEAADSGQ